MLAFGSGLPFWTPLFLLCLLILSSVWGMPLILNKQALEDLFQQKGPAKADQCPDAVNPAVKVFLSWPNNQANVDKAVPEKESNNDQLFDQQGLLNSQALNSQNLGLNSQNLGLNSQNMELNSQNLKQNSQNLEPNSQNIELNSQNLQLQPAAMEAKEKVLDQKKELKAQEEVNDGNEVIRQAPDYKMLEKVKGSKSKLINTPMMDYKREFASDEANPYVESLRQRYEPLPFAYKD